MDTSARKRGYDLFKLIVAIILLILFLILILRGTPQSPALISMTPSTATISPPATTSDQTPTKPVTATPTFLPPTATAAALPSPTATNIPASTATPLPPPAGTPVIESTTTQTVAPSTTTACEAATARSRLQVGASAMILRRLNFRSSPGIRDNWIRTNIPGTSVEVVGGPECLPHFIGAYVWWQIKLPDGQIGWSAESSWGGGFYFIEPVE